MNYYSGRPEDCESRLPREVRVYDLLDSLGIEYGRVDHSPAENMEDCVAIDEALGAVMCKNLFLCNRRQTAFYLLLMPADKPFKTKDISAQIRSARLSFGSAEKLGEYLDIMPGAVSVMGLMNDGENRVRLLVDSDLLGDEYLGVHPCVNTSSLKLRTEDVFVRFLDAVLHEKTVVKL